MSDTSTFIFIFLKLFFTGFFGVSFAVFSWVEFHRVFQGEIRAARCQLLGVYFAGIPRVKLWGGGRVGGKVGAWVGVYGRVGTSIFYLPIGCACGLSKVS
jgi:hypothetical protein